jgi:CRP/FNR family transcriptional regulator, cyclic AMP receptor protein
MSQSSLPMPTPDLSPFPLFRAASAQTRKAIIGHASQSHFMAQTAFWKSGDPHVCAILSGQCCLQMGDQRDKSVTIGFYQAGSILGIAEASSTSIASSSLYALSNGIALLVPLNLFDDLLKKDMALQAGVATLLARETLALRQHVFDLVTLSVPQRVAGFVLAYAKACEGQIQVIGPPTHEALAGYIGSNREAITRAFRTLEDARLLSYSRQQITILDRARLQAFTKEHAKSLGSLDRT